MVIMAASRPHMVVPSIDENSPININRVAEAKCSSPLVSKNGAKGGANGGALSPKKNKKRAPREKGTFGRLLADVTNEQSKETQINDAKFAVETQAEEAMEMANEWIREEADAKVAAELSEKLQYEDKMAKEKQL